MTSDPTLVQIKLSDKVVLYQFLTVPNVDFLHLLAR